MEKIKELMSIIFGSRLLIDGKTRTFVKVPMWLAVLADTGVCLICVLNAVRLIRSKRN